LLLCHCHSTSLLTGVSNVTPLSYLMITRHIPYSQREHRLCWSDDLSFYLFQLLLVIRLLSVQGCPPNIVVITLLFNLQLYLQLN